MGDQVEGLGTEYEQPVPRRRAVLKAVAALGVGGPTFARALAAQADAANKVSPEMVKQAEWIAGITLTEEERKATAKTLAETLGELDALRKVPLGYDVPPALTFYAEPPRPAAAIVRGGVALLPSEPVKRPSSDEDLAFLTVAELAALLRSRQVTSTELTKLYLARLKRFDPLLKCVVTYTESLAFEQAKRADAEIAAGKYRGPLHGIPWGAKDLIAYPGYPTTWGATPFREQKLDVKATVAERLDAAGAVLVAKLSLGALAMGDKWFGGRTNSPWDPRRGSSGSSAGSAAATAAGLVGFSIGSETLGSIISPCRACGATGLRPTFGRVSRTGCMTLAWSMDKIGPITRSALDCALVLDAIHGADGLDPAALDHPFTWPSPKPLESLKIGFIDDKRRPLGQRRELLALQSLGFNMVPITLPEELPIQAVTIMLSVEAATVFDELTRKHVAEGLNSWPDTFRMAQFVPAVEYLRAARIRTRLIRAMAERFEKVDLYVASGLDLPITNLTGHPSVVLPFCFTDRDGRPAPGSLVLTGKLWDEATLLSAAIAIEARNRDNRQRPPLESFLAEAATAPSSTQH